jgi:hypothetical protein
MASRIVPGPTAVAHPDTIPARSRRGPVAILPSAAYHARVPGETTVATIRCPTCERPFRIDVETPGTEFDCPHCGLRLRLDPEAAPPPAPASPPPPPASSAGAPAAAPPAGPRIDLKRTCPACGTRYPGSQRRCPRCGEGFREAKYAEEDARTGSSFAPEKAAINMGVVGGILLIVVAVAWFVGGYLAGYIFFYPPILAVIGVFAIVKGLVEGNFAGGGRYVSSRGRTSRAGSRRGAVRGRRRRR